MPRIGGILMALTIGAGGLGAAPALPANTINCAQFHQLGNTWLGNGDVTFRIGQRTVTFDGAPIVQGAFHADGIDVYRAIQEKCGS